MEAWNLLALTIAALFFKHVVVVLVQLFDRMRSKSFRYEEDAKLMNAAKGDPPLTAQAQCLIRNSLENEPFFILLLFALFSLHVDGQFHPHLEYAEAGQTYAGVFVGARVLHALFFLARQSMLRTLSYTVGLLASVGVAVQVIMSAIE